MIYVTYFIELTAAASPVDKNFDLLERVKDASGPRSSPLSIASVTSTRKAAWSISMLTILASFSYLDRELL